VILKPMRAFLIRRYLFYVLSRLDSWLRAQKTPRIWRIYKQSKILRHQLERFVSSLELRLQTARRGKASGPDIWGWRPDFWCTKMDMRAANLGGRSIALGKISNCLAQSICKLINIGFPSEGFKRSNRSRVLRVFGYFRHKKQLFIFRDSTADGQPPAPYGNGGVDL
jgi:hypothetical protein